MSRRFSTTASSTSSTSGLRTLDDVRAQVAAELAFRAVTNAETVDGVRLGVVLTLPTADDAAFLRRVAAALDDQLLYTPRLFALATTGADAHLLLTSFPAAHVERAQLLATAAFPTRVHASSTSADGSSFAAAVKDITPADEPALWKALRQSIVHDEPVPPKEMLVDTRRRLTPREALAAVHGQEETDLDVLGGLDTTLDTVRDQVASELALRTLSTAETIDGARLGVLLTLGKTDDPTFLRRVARALSRQFLDTPHLFALATTGADAHLLLMGSPPASVQRALLLTMAAFSARVHASSLADDGSSFAAAVQDITPADEPVLWRALRQSLARDEHTPPPGSRGVVQRLADARRGVRRLTPREAFDAVQGVGDAAGDALGGPTFLVDIRAAPRRGGITGSLIVDRNDLEWAFDPRLAVRVPAYASHTSSSSVSSAPGPATSPPPDRPGAPVPAAASPTPPPATDLEAALRVEHAAEEHATAQHLLIATSYALRPILICADGRASSLAAASLRELGLYNATDVIGGFRAWRAAGLGTWEEGGGEGVGEGEGEGEVREGEGEEAEEAEEEGEEEGEEAVGEEGERESGDGTQGEYVLL